MLDLCDEFLCTVEGFLLPEVSEVVGELTDVESVPAVGVVAEPAVLAVEEPVDEPDVESLDSGAAHAAPAVAPTPAPIPSATAKAPTRPT